MPDVSVKVIYFVRLILFNMTDDVQERLAAFIWSRELLPFDCVKVRFFYQYYHYQYIFIYKLKQSLGAI